MDNEIACAFKNGDYKRASELLQKVRDFKDIGLLQFYPQNCKHFYCNIYNVSLLHLATYHGWLDICHQLVTEYKYNPHILSSFGSLTNPPTQTHFHSLLPPPPLFYATQGGHYEVITYLINKCNCDPHQKSEDGETPLYVACLAGHYDIVTYLINECHCDPNTGGSYSPLHGACEGGNLQIVKYLTSLSSVNMNIKDEDGYTPLHTACRYGQLDIIKFLLCLPLVDLNIRISSYSALLHKACRYGELQIIKFLVSLPSVDVNIRSYSGYTPLHTACRYGQLDIIKFLVSLSSVDVNIPSYRGYTPLHTACRYGQLGIIKFLVSLSSVDINSTRDGDDYTPLHTACRYGQLDIIKFLVSLSSVDVNIPSYSGYTPLHTACRYGQLGIIKFLVSLSSVDINSTRDDDDYTPLHTACRYGQLDIIKFLVSLPSVDVNIRTYSGYTPLHTACQYGQLDIIKFLVSLSSVDVNIRSYSGYTPLHTACQCGQLDIIKFLVSLSSIDVNIQCYSGYTPLHTACEYGQLYIIKFLVSLSSVDINSTRDGDDYTPLHTACEYGQLDIVKFLVSLPSVNVKIRISNYSILLHKACRYGELQVIKFLVSLPSIDVNIQGDAGYTPLHTACHYGELDIIKFLMSTEKINLMSTNKIGDTPLHIACTRGYVNIVKYLLSTGRMDPMAENRDQHTPVQLAGYNYDILTLFQPFEQCREDFPIESFSKVFLCGNSTNGKSSLANALCQRVKGISWLERLNPFKQQERAEPLTAGIVPHHLQSNEIGNIVLYDFAGHPEYYSSHEAVLENLMLKSPAVFIILIKLTDKLEDIEKQLYYWASFLENVGCRMSKKSQVIVVGSHADKRRADNVINLIKKINIQKIIEHQEYKGFVAVDCRNKYGVGFDEFVMCLSESTKTIVNTSDSISFYCHVLYAFLKTKLDQVAITLDNLLQRIQFENEPSIPSNESVLIEFLTILSDKGLIVFIKCADSIHRWVIINKTSLLKEINGTLFAPSYFKEYRSTLASNTGIVPVSVLSDVFPQYNPDMLVGFLKSLEFCHEIDEDTLQIITNTLPSRYSYSDKLLYFPTLASEPMKNVEITNGFGWCLWCPNPNQFFSTRFLHVLLLRLAHKSSLKRDDGIITPSTETRVHVKDLNRSCNIWKNGMCWTRDGVKCIVQVSEQNRSVILLVQPVITGSDKECIQVRNSIITMIHLIRNEFCSSCDIQEYLISPNQLHSILQCELSESSIFRIEHVARAVLFKMPVTNENETLELSSLLGQLEPYHILPLSLIQRLFDDSKSSQCIPEHLYREIQERCRPIMDIYMGTRESSTYQSIRDHLNRFSIFVGRNPFVSE